MGQAICVANGMRRAEVIEAAARGAGVGLTGYQRAFLEDASPLRSVLKARQTGFSWLFALEALAEALAHGRFSIFVSLNREEAAEKIAYARDLYDGLPEAMRPALLRAGANEVRFAGGGRLLSFPCRAPRGKARANLYLDEMAFYPNAGRVYSGALPVVSHGGRVTLASTPCGDRGLFYRALTDPEIAGRFSRHIIPWWRAPWFAKDPPQEIEALETEERVRRCGTPVLVRLFEAMERTSFQQEYEARFVDTHDAFIPWSEIEAGVADILLAPTWRDLPQGVPLYAGMDIGRFQDPTEIVVLRQDGEAWTVCAVRTLRDVPFDEQVAMAAQAMEAGILRLCVDATGLGSGVAEGLRRRFRERVLPVIFTLALKEHIATRVRMGLQGGTLRLPGLPSFLEQIHAIRQGVTGAGRLRLDAPRADGGHADQFWALALALHAAEARGGLVRTHALS